MSPREVANRAGFSYHAILRAIHRGDLQAFEPVPGQYRIELRGIRALAAHARSRENPSACASDLKTKRAHYLQPHRSWQLRTPHSDRRKSLMELRKRSGKWQLRWREGGHKRARTFDRKSDAVTFEAERVRRKQLGHAAIPEDVPLAEFIETYWRLHAVPNLAESTRDFYKLTWVNHIMPRLGEYGVRELTPKRLARFREELERDGVGAATVVKAMRDRPVDHLVRDQRGTGRVQRRGVCPKTALPAGAGTARLPAHGRRADSRASSASSGIERSCPCWPTRARDPKRWCSVWSGAMSEHGPSITATRNVIGSASPRSSKPLAEDLDEWFVASGRPAPTAPVFPAHNGSFWDQDDWRNWRNRVWKGNQRRSANDSRPSPRPPGVAPAGTRPRDLRSSYITLRVYEGVPLTTISKEVGTSIQMIEQHYAGVIENWDGRRVPAERQIRAARRTGGRKMDAKPKTDPVSAETKSL